MSREDQLLQALYSAFLGGDVVFDWKDWAAQEGIPGPQSELAYELLAEEGLVRAGDLGSLAGITSKKIKRVENFSLAKPDAVHRQREIRLRLLQVVAAGDPLREMKNQYFLDFLARGCRCHGKGDGQ